MKYIIFCLLAPDVKLIWLSISSYSLKHLFLEIFNVSNKILKVFIWTYALLDSELR